MLVQLSLLVICLLQQQSQAFIQHQPVTPRKLFGFPQKTLQNSLVTADEPNEIESDDQGDASTVVRAPLKFIGPYPCLALRFPDLSTTSQKARNETGISLDFMLDTAANTNTIQEQVAKELTLDVVGEALPGIGSAGSISGGKTYLLGDCELDGTPTESRFTFMTELSASALPIASPAAAGLLSSAFLNCFSGGVEFQWVGSTDGDDTDSFIPPSVTFYGERKDLQSRAESMTCIPIQPLPISLLPSVTIHINGEEIPALLDTGSPVTVMNAKAADIANISRITLSNQQKEEGGNPFSNMMQKMKAAQEMSQAAAKGDILLVGGTSGEMIELNKSESKLNISLKKDENELFELGNSHIYVGDLPGLAALGGLEGKDSTPAAILGMDVLRLRPNMIYCGQSSEVYF